MLTKQGLGSLINKHLHIGQTNVIAREFARHAVKTVRYSDYKNHFNAQIDSVSVSAFNPLNKTAPLPDQSFELSLIETLPRDIPLIYFSTMRVGGRSAKHQNYSSNKKLAEDLLLKNFENLTILRLPNLVGPSGEVLSKFQKAIKEGIRNGKIIFDCNRKSEWVFLSSNFLINYCIKIINNNEVLGQTIKRLETHYKITAEDISTFCSQHFEINLVKYGISKLEYDEQPNIPSVYSNQAKNEILSLLLLEQ